jgi:alkylation response protein AidB-like acyl-CoA dehydrogenase
MDLESEEHRQFRASVRAFAEREVRPLVDEAEARQRFPRERVLPAMGRLGFFGIGVAPELGGTGGDAYMPCILAEELGRICGGIAISVVPSVVGPALLAQLGSDAQRDGLLPRIMAGEKLVALALTEPGAGSDLARLATTVTPDGDDFVLDGSKTFITNAPCADLALVAAVHSDFASRAGLARSAGIHLYLVDLQAPGCTTSAPMRKLGMHSSETGEIFFDSCRIPQANRFGSEKVRFHQVMRVLDATRLYVAALSVGLARAALEAARDYAKERHTFGRAIGRHQAIAFKIADMAVQIDAARLLVRHAAARIDAGARASAAVARAKLFATEMAVAVTGEAIQIHGGYGYMQDFPAERYFRDARVGTIWEGTSEMQRLLIAGDLGLFPGDGS